MARRRYTPFARIGVSREWPPLEPNVPTVILSQTPESWKPIRRAARSGHRRRHRPDLARFYYPELQMACERWQECVLDRVDAVALDDELRKVIEMVVVAGSTAATKWVL